MRCFIDIAKAVELYGINNVRFLIPMRALEFIGFIPGLAFESSNTPEDTIECVITEKNYKVRDNYKIELTPVNSELPSSKHYGGKRFYISDLEALMIPRVGPADHKMMVRESAGQPFIVIDVENF